MSEERVETIGRAFPGAVLPAEHDALKARHTRLLDAAKAVDTAVVDSGSGDLFHSDPDTWNHDAHIEISITIGEALALRAAIAESEQQ